MSTVPQICRDEGYKKIAPHIRDEHLRILATFREQDMTCWDLAIKFGLPHPYNIRPRTSELYTAGFIRPISRRTWIPRPDISETTETVWGVTPDGLSLLS